MYRKKSLGNVILLSLEKAVDGMVRINDFAQKPGYYAFWDGWNYPLHRSALSKTIKRLREKGLVDFVDDDRLAIRLTGAGQDKAVLVQMLLDEEKWDGMWRILIFDVPEKRRLVRDVLRSKLKIWGFTPWQQSVWITKKNCTKPLKKFINQVGIKDWVKVFEAEKIDL